MPVQDTQILLAITDNRACQIRLHEVLLPQRNCIFVSSATEGYALLKSRLRPSLILLDADLPADSAFSFYSKLKCKTAYENIPVLFMLEKNSLKEARCLSLGASDVTVKSCSTDVLNSRIDKILSDRYVSDYLVSKIYSYKDSLQEEHAKLVRYTKQVIRSLAKAIDAKDQYTKGHSLRVAEYSVRIARRMGLDEQICEIIYQSGLLHDIGKIGISDAVLRKPGELNEMEIDAIRNHPLMGYQILSGISEIPLVALGAKYHHERYDGKGYPEGLKGDGIPLIARIICVADSYDAMTSDRSYRTPLSPMEARREILRCAGTQFDPEIADVAAQLIKEKADGMPAEKNEVVFSSFYGDISFAV